MAGPSRSRTLGDVDDYLEHYGVKGMKWGVRRRGPAVEPSADAARSSELQSRLKSGGPASLSNKELQEVVTRMNLEQQYSRLNPKKQSKGADYVSVLLTGGSAFASTKMGSDVIDKYAGQYAPVVKGAITVANIAVAGSKKKKK